MFPPGDPRTPSPELKERPDTKRLPWPKHLLPNKDEDPLPAHVKLRLLANTHVRPETNPTVMDKPFWKYMIAKGQDAYSADTMLGICPFKDGPSWSFDRWGRSTTWLPDGRAVFIGGTHEGFYEFPIHNDVVVVSPRVPAEVVTRYAEVTEYGPLGFSWPDLEWLDDEEDQQGYIEFKRREMNEPPRPEEIMIYGYPEEVFPPTDWHVAVYVKTEEGRESIYIIGGEGEAKSVHRQRTCVFRLNLSDFSIEYAACKGELPPHESNAVHARRARLIGGEIITRERNGEKYALNLETLWWRKVTKDVEFELEAEDLEENYADKVRPVSEDIEKGYL